MAETFPVTAIPAQLPSSRIELQLEFHLASTRSCNSTAGDFWSANRKNWPSMGHGCMTLSGAARVGSIIIIIMIMPKIWRKFGTRAATRLVAANSSMVQLVNHHRFGLRSRSNLEPSIRTRCRPSQYMPGVHDVGFSRCTPKYNNGRWNAPLAYQGCSHPFRE
ncbi:hypothetical protein BJX76DRAFT_88538 [Aspergillus varians]